MSVAEFPNCQGPGGTRCEARDAPLCQWMLRSRAFAPLMFTFRSTSVAQQLCWNVGGCANVFWIYRHIEDVVACLQGEGA